MYADLSRSSSAHRPEFVEVFMRDRLQIDRHKNPINIAITNFDLGRARRLG
jgi:hypothetical protein